MKLRVCAMGAAAFMLCSSSIASAGEVVRPSQSPGVAKSWQHAKRASPKLQHANHDGALIPIVIAGVAAGGTAIYFATKEDNKASR